MAKTVVEDVEVAVILSPAQKVDVMRLRKPSGADRLAIANPTVFHQSSLPKPMEDVFSVGCTVIPTTAQPIFHAKAPRKKPEGEANKTPSLFPRKHEHIGSTSTLSMGRAS